MADMSSSIFNKKATEKLRNPDDLEKYVRVTNPSVWIVLFACIALLAGLLAWGVFGSVTTSVVATGTVVSPDEKSNPVALCLLNAEDAAKVHAGDSANVDGEKMTVRSVEAVPVSSEEARALLHSDYLVSALMQADWAYVVYFDGDTSEFTLDVPVSVHITVERIAPISLILKNWG